MGPVTWCHRCRDWSEVFRKPILITCATGLEFWGQSKVTAFPAASFLQSCCRLLNIRVVGALYYFRKTRELEMKTSASPNARASTFDYHRFKNWLKQGRIYCTNSNPEVSSRFEVPYKSNGLQRDCRCRRALSLSATHVSGWQIDTL